MDAREDVNNLYAKTAEEAEIGGESKNPHL